MDIVLRETIGGRSLSIQTGKLAKQASGAAVVQYGDTIVLVTVVSPLAERESDFLPLQVEYQEKIYAAGRIPGNYFRREIGRPSEKETLTARLIDRPIRPLFPKTWRSEIQVIATVLSMDQENDPDTLAMVGASAAIHLSDIPFAGPIAAVRVGRIGGELKINPPLQEWPECDINIIVAGSQTGVVMVEGGAGVVSEAEMLEAIFFGHRAMQPLIAMQAKLRETHGKPKRPVPVKETDAAFAAQVTAAAREPLKQALLTPTKLERQAAVRAAKAAVLEALGPEAAAREAEVAAIFDDLKRAILRELILTEGRRVDGRRIDEIRPIACEVAVLPRPHGSALFTRGETQVLGVLTLGSGQDEQRVETLSGEEMRPFMLHYNFPPYSVGEVKRVVGPSRRDIGHGGLSSRAIERILPPKETFDYTIRLVSEVLESNGSSSMGTVCACCLALMDGGVPIKAPVAGIAMGLVSEGDRTVVLSDILGDEDHAGDMDFKVAGTRDGITAMQMDIKIHELPRAVLERALEQARLGRLHILNRMLEALPAPRKEISPYAPTITTLTINPDKIREVIGPGGKTIRAIQSQTNTTIEIEDSGLVKIAAFSKQEAEQACNLVKQIVSDPEVGAVYEGTVVKITDFGAFVNILPGTDGLVHISQLSSRRVTRVSDVVKEGDKIKVKVLEVSRDGKIRLSHKALLEEDHGRPHR